MRKIYLLGAMMLLSQLMWAQQDTLQTVLEEVVITAIRTPQQVLKAARSIDVIDSKTINELPYNTVGELLENQTGLYVVGSGQTPGANQSLFMRGSNSNQTSILINGIRITDPSTPNGAIDLSEISLSNVERIEILRGSHSAIYGTGTIGGVVNIITKEGKDGLSGDVQAQLGALGNGGLSTAQSAFINYGNNGFYVNGAIFNNNTNGLNAARDTTTTDNFRVNDNDDFSKTDLSAQIGFDGENLKVFVGYKKTDQRADIDQGAFNDDDNYFVEFDRDFFNYGAQYDINSWSFKFNGSVTSSERLSLNDSSVVDEAGNYDQQYFSSTTAGKLATHELQTSYTQHGVTALAGIGRYYEEMDLESYVYSNGPFGLFEQTTNYDSVDLSTTTDYLFGSVNFDFEELIDLDGFALTLAGRYSEINEDYSNVSFELSPAYRFNKSTVYFSYAEGFNNPSLIQLYDPNGQFNFTTRGNSNLEEETSTTIELGYKQLIKKNISLTAAIYQTKVKNAIEYVYLWNGNTDINSLSFLDYLGDTYINIAEQTVKGMELGVEAQISAKLHFNANLTFIDGSYNFSPDDIDQGYVAGNHVQLFNNGLFINNEQESEGLVRRPSHQIFTQLAYSPIDKLTLTGSLRIVDSRPDSFYDPSLGPFGALNAEDVPSYTLVGFNANYKFSTKIYSTLRLENLLNEDYQEINGFNTRGRSLYLKVGHKF